jgi:hypothetical protein
MRKYFRSLIGKKYSGQSLVEILLAIALASLILPGIIVAITASGNGKAQQKIRFNGITLMKEAQEAVRSVREKGWTTFALNGTYHPVNVGSSWTLAANAETVNGITRQIIISDVNRDTVSGAIVSSPAGVVDASTKKVDIAVSWLLPIPSTMTSTIYLTRYLENLSFNQLPPIGFNLNTLVNTALNGSGEVTLALNGRAKWCSPVISSATIDLPDGPPVAVAARSNAVTTTIPNDVFVATAPNTGSSIKMAYLNVTANTDPPVSTLKGIFSLDSTKYSVPSGINLDNNFKTNDIKYYTSAAGKLYALMAIDKPDKEVIAIQINNGSGDSFQDPANKVYKYWTFFNTRIFNSSAGLDTGYANPSANAAVTVNAGDNNGYNSSPTLAYASDNSYAIDGTTLNGSGSGNGVLCTGNDKDKHLFYNYGLTVPSGATINGIEVRLDALIDSQVGMPFMCIQLSWDGGNTWTAAKSTTTLNTTKATYTLGGPADTWNRSWSNANINNANFRLRIIDVASNTSRRFSLDWAAVKVYYSLVPSATNDQDPYGTGASNLTILEDTGYIDSGGYLYAFDLSNIDSKSASSELDQVGCRILLDGYDCSPDSATNRKYSAGETGASWSDTTARYHNDCSEAGNIELTADHQLSAVTVGSNKYVYAAVGASTDSELDIVDVTTPPASLGNSSCGRGNDTGWKKTGSLDFNTLGGTEEAANSVYAKSDGTKAYISSNGGIDANHDGKPDSYQFYIIDTTDKSAPKFLSGTSTPPTSGYYYGGIITPTPNGPTFHNEELFTKRALTVLNGLRAVLVGNDGYSNSNNAQEYQVINMSSPNSEASPVYCGGVDFDQGFNDLTSVSEADGDNYVYMVANTMEKQLKIIQGGPDGTYLDNGSVESTTMDAGYSTAFNSFTATTILPANTNIKFQFAGVDPLSGSDCSSVTFNFVGPDGTEATYYPASGGPIFIGSSLNGNKNPARCFRYKAYFSTTDYNVTPTLQNIFINYSP